MNKKTFNECWSEVQEMVSDTNTTTLTYIKKWINQAQRIYNNETKRYFLRASKTANIVADQQYYQLPIDCVRILPSPSIQTTAQPWPMTEIQSEAEWNTLNKYKSKASYPTHYFLRGKNEIGLYPIPSGAITNGLILPYEKGEKTMTQADFTTGTVTVTNGSATITHSATGFTALMVGRYFQVTDGSEGYWYKIASFTSTSAMVLENVYQGSTGAAKTFIIGESSQVPDEFHESFVDYAMYRYYLMKRDLQSANEFKALFESSLGKCKEIYAAKTSSAVIHSNRRVVQNPFFQVDQVT